MGARTDRQASPAVRWLRAAVALLAAAAVLGYLGIATIHLRYPFELEWKTAQPQAVYVPRHSGDGGAP